MPRIRSAGSVSRLERNKPARANELLEVAKRYELGGDLITPDLVYPVFLRGQAYLMQRKANVAIAVAND
jgi:hypothetical protein